MTIIRRTNPSAAPELNTAEKARILIVVINCLRELGEPATALEIAAYARPRISGPVAANLGPKVEAVLRQYSQPSPGSAEPPPFERVGRGVVEAWAFSATFRDALAESGLQIRARAAPPGAGS